MGLYPIFNTHAQFHADYCREMLRERNIRYSKTRPNGVVELEYLKELIEREKQTSHLKSFKTFLEFCNKIKLEM